MNNTDHFHITWRVNRDCEQIGDICAGDIPIAQVQMQAPLAHKKDGNQIREMLTEQIVAEHNSLVGINPSGISAAIDALNRIEENDIRCDSPESNVDKLRVIAREAIRALKPNPIQP